MSEDTKRMADRVKRFSTRKRAKCISLGRFRANVHRRPWALAPALLLLAALCWAMTWATIPFPAGSNNLLLTALWNASAKLAIILVAVLLTLGVFTAPPKKALEYEAGLAHIGFTDRYGNPPALVSRVCTNKTEKLTFYSAGITLETWVERQEQIQDALSVAYLEPPQYAYRKRYYIMLTAVPGIGGPRKGSLYDDEL